MQQQEQKDAKVTLVILMGPSGCGKTTIAQLMAQRLSVPFLEGDQFHPACNIDKMSNGIPLNDDDRWPWLDSIRQHCTQLSAEFKAGGRSSTIVLACSALKRIYRDYLRETSLIDHIIFIYPKGSFELIHKRMSQREHYMKASMLQSQFTTMEPPDSEPDVITVDISHDQHEIVGQIINHIKID